MITQQNYKLLNYNQIQIFNITEYIYIYQIIEDDQRRDGVKPNMSDRRKQRVNTNTRLEIIRIYNDYTTKLQIMKLKSHVNIQCN